LDGGKKKHSAAAQGGSGALFGGIAQLPNIYLRQGAVECAHTGSALKQC